MSKETIKAIGKSSYGFGWKVNKISVNHVTARLCLWTFSSLNYPYWNAFCLVRLFTSFSFGMNERLTTFLQSTGEYIKLKLSKQWPISVEITISCLWPLEMWRVLYSSQQLYILSLSNDLSMINILQILFFKYLNPRFT